MNFICKVVGHSRDAWRAWHDGIDWRSSCTRCKAPLIKDEAISAWRGFDFEKDHSIQRRGKPDRFDRI